jgi:hypothetical protein
VLLQRHGVAVEQHDTGCGRGQQRSDPPPAQQGVHEHASRKPREVLHGGEEDQAPTRYLEDTQERRIPARLVDEEADPQEVVAVAAVPRDHVLPRIAPQERRAVRDPDGDSQRCCREQHEEQRRVELGESADVAA